MRKLFVLITILNCLSLQVVFSNEWNDFGDLDKVWDGQETITDKEYQQTLDVLEEKQKKKDKKARTKMIKRVSGGGTSLHSELNPDIQIDAFSPLKEEDGGMLLNVPVNLIIDDFVLDKGFYKIIADKDKNGDVYLSFYQSQFFKGKVRASITKNDYGEEELNFIKLLPYNENFIKIIFGSLKCNAFAYIRYVNN